MKYEMIFGDYEFASSTSEIAIRSGYGDTLEMSLIAPIVIPDEWSVIAMRRIIKEPNRWTWEDKKAGRLPEVGCRVSSVAYGHVCSVVAIDSNSRHVWCQFPDQSVGSCMIFEINPIETPAEKEQREEDEWVNKAWSETAVFAGVTQDEHDRLRIHLRHIYRAQLSGELAAPKGGE